jgi:hypothetical protein
VTTVQLGAEAAVWESGHPIPDFRSRSASSFSNQQRTEDLTLFLQRWIATATLSSIISRVTQRFRLGLILGYYSSVGLRIHWAGIDTCDATKLAWRVVVGIVYLDGKQNSPGVLSLGGSKLVRDRYYGFV